MEHEVHVEGEELHKLIEGEEELHMLIEGEEELHMLIEGEDIVEAASLLMVLSSLLRFF
jgi:hypothetical protein